MQQHTSSPTATAPQTARHEDPFTAIFGGHLLGPDGRLSQADIVISQGLIAEIGSLVCPPDGARLVDATGSVVRRRGHGAAIAIGQTDDLELVPLG